eukprot:365123-Chlamydomonas_euryale.AAC.28
MGRQHVHDAGALKGFGALQAMSVPMASAEQLERWKAIGGRVEETATKKKGAKKDVPSVFISPSGARRAAPRAVCSWSAKCHVHSREQGCDGLADGCLSEVHACCCTFH